MSTISGRVERPVRRSLGLARKLSAPWHEIKPPEATAPRPMLGAAIAFIAVVILGLAVSSLGAADGRDFSAMYSLTQVNDSGDPVLLTFSFRLFNHGPDDLNAVTIVLRDRAQSDQNYAVFTGVSVLSGDEVSLSQSITVPADEYQQWLNGAPPLLLVQLSSGEERPVEVVPDPMGGAQ